MKMVVAIIRPERLPCVHLAISKFNAELMAVTETHSYGQEEGQTLIYRASQIHVRSAPRLRVEILTEAEDAEDVVDAVLNSGFSKGSNSQIDGRIFVVSLDRYMDRSRAEHAAPVRF